MRNIMETPVTKEEIIDTLLRLADEFEGEEKYGDMRPLILKQAAQHVAYSAAPLNEMGLVFLDYIPQLRANSRPQKAGLQ